MPLFILLSGLIVCIKGQTTLPWWSYIIALLLGAFVTPFSTLLYARLGNGIATNQLMKMVAGAVNPGRPVANLYVRSILRRQLGCETDLARLILSVLHVEPRRDIDLNRAWAGLEDGTVLEDSTKGYVLDPGLGYTNWRVGELWYVTLTLVTLT